MADVNKLEALLVLSLTEQSSSLADQLLASKDREIAKLKGLVEELADALARFWNHYPPRRDTPELLDIAAAYTSPGVYPPSPFTGTE